MAITYKYGFEAVVSPCRNCGLNGDRRRCSLNCQLLAEYRATKEFPPPQKHQSAEVLVRIRNRWCPIPIWTIG